QEAVRAESEEPWRDVVRLCVMVFVRPVERALEHVAAALRDEIDEEPRRLHGDVAPAVGDLDLFKRVEVEIRGGRVRRQVRNVRSLEIPLHAGGRAARGQADLLTGRGATDVQTRLHAGRQVDDLPRIACGGNV